MTDSIWSWLYLLVGVALCTTNLINLIVNGRRIPAGHELEAGIVLTTLLAVILTLWPLWILWCTVGVLITRKEGE